MKTNPTGQTCTVSAGSGTVASANITNVVVSCTNVLPYLYGRWQCVGVVGDGGAAGQRWGRPVAVSANGPFTFATALVSGTAYRVKVKTSPTGQTCTVSAGSGTIASANITNVVVSCTKSFHLYGRRDGVGVVGDGGVAG